MKTVDELIDDASQLATRVAMVKKLASDLAHNIKMASTVLAARDLDTIKAAYSQAEMESTSKALDDAIAAARARG